ncbi:MAG: type II toxin-antitoxin system VapC family toxin [Chloroflexi bacterium]|nr:type II toxin-antitoxin system VapC family toxin [Chloroflexota bacterium]
MTDAPLLDTNVLSEIMRGKNLSIQNNARAYLAQYGQFRFSILTRYEILRGFEAKQATAQLARFQEQCRKSDILPLTDEIVERAAKIYGQLHREGRLITDADILIAATAMVHHLALVTENVKHMNRISGLQVASWQS